MSRTIGGGIKKVLYTLQTARRIGLLDSTKALSANNACKACGLGMGGQKGGMTNEMGEFPSVCNKSLRAQSTDIQPPIPLEVFQHSIAELRELDGHELEHLGNWDYRSSRQPESDSFSVVDWDWALQYAVNRQPQRNIFLQLRALIK